MLTAIKQWRINRLKIKIERLDTEIKVWYQMLNNYKGFTLGHSREVVNLQSDLAAAMEKLKQLQS